ncbi:MAG: helix-turn-helix domain-containing protein [Cyanobacteriota bacterium]
MDDIISHRCSSITLTNLEEQSHYSARHLQSLFRKKFGCTPIQFVRRQRLEEAMEQ